MAKSRSGSLEDLFLRLRAFAAKKDRKLKAVTLRVCPEVKKTSLAPQRAFGHWGHVKGAICVAHQLAKLPLGYQAGIILHEMGHCGSGAGELAADNWVFEKLGISLVYRSPRHLEWVDPKVIRLLGI